MAIELDTPSTSNRPPVIGARGVGQTVIGRIVDKTMRARQDKDGNPILNSRGRPAQEEVITILVEEGTTGTISGGDLNDDWTPEAGTVCRLIFKGMGYGKLIDARKTIGATQVGDVITVTAESAVIWRGAGDIAAQGVTDEAQITKARIKGLSIGWEIDVAYRRATPAEAKAVAAAETAHHDLKAAAHTPIALDDDEAF